MPYTFMIDRICIANFKHFLKFDFSIPLFKFKHHMNACLKDQFKMFFQTHNSNEVI